MQAPHFRYASLTILLIVMSSLASVDAVARDWYVDNLSGNDDANGTRIAPLRTIRVALKHAETGDRLVLNNTGTPYRESFTLSGFRHSGTRFSPFTIVGNGAVLDGRRDVLPTEWEHAEGDVFRFRPPSLSHQVLYVDNLPGERVEIASSADILELTAGQWALKQGWLYFCAGPNRTPAAYDLSCCDLQVGITLYRVHDVRIEGLYVQGFHLDGVNCHDLCRGIELANMNCRGNGRSGISVGGSSRCLLNSVVAGDNFAAQVRAEGYCKLDLQNCELIDARPYGPPIQREGGEVRVDGDQK